MNKNRSEYSRNDAELKFDFDEWVKLYRHSPQEFEQRQRQWSERIINNSAQSHRRRLSGILFQNNMEKRRANNPLQHCMRISQMMWDKFNRLNSELQALHKDPLSALLSREQNQCGQLIGAEVLAFGDHASDSRKRS